MSESNVILSADDAAALRRYLEAARDLASAAEALESPSVYSEKFRARLKALRKASERVHDFALQLAASIPFAKLGVNPKPAAWVTSPLTTHQFLKAAERAGLTSEDVEVVDSVERGSRGCKARGLTPAGEKYLRVRCGE